MFSVVEMQELATENVVRKSGPVHCIQCMLEISIHYVNACDVTVGMFNEG